MLHTAVDEGEIFKRGISARDEYGIAYYASDGVVINFERIVKPILKDIGTVLSGRIHWHFFTSHPDMSDTPYADSVTYYDAMPLEDFREMLNNTRIDIGIAPLLESEFNSGKYVNKFFEYSRAMS